MKLPKNSVLRLNIQRAPPICGMCGKKIPQSKVQKCQFCECILCEECVRITKVNKIISCEECASRRFEQVLVKDIIGTIYEDDDWIIPQFKLRKNIPIRRKRWHIHRLSNIKSVWNDEKSRNKLQMTPNIDYYVKKPIELLNIKGKYFVYGDGNHRVAFAKQNNIKTIMAEIFTEEEYFVNQEEKQAFYHKYGFLFK